jgi:glycosyltransferase involved in cell wall biosynthesis
MNIWLLHVGEDLSTDGSERRFRYGRLAEALVDRGHRVLRWAPTFHHATKRFRAHDNQLIAASEDYDVQLVHAPGYRRNVSLARRRSYRRLEAAIKPLMKDHTRPDLIVAAVPTIGWCRAAIEYGKFADVPVIVDVRDLWPDVYLTAVPAALRGLARVLLEPAFRSAQSVCREADALLGVSQTYLDWGLNLAGREASASDGVFPLGHDPVVMSPEVLRREQAELLRVGVDPLKSICMYAGLFETSYDLLTVVNAAKQMHAAGRRDVQFVLCGDGSQMPAVRRAAAALPNVVLLGWVRAETINALMGWSQIGLAAYSKGALQSLPNKLFEYLAGELAIASSLTGELPALLKTHRCGVTYEAGDSTSLTTALTGVLASPARLDSMRRRSKALFQEKYASPKIYARLADHLVAIARQDADRANSRAA